MEQEESWRDEMKAIAAAIRALEKRAKGTGAVTLAYLLDMAALEAETRARSAAS